MRAQSETIKGVGSSECRVAVVAQSLSLPQVVQSALQGVIEDAGNDVDAARLLVYACSAGRHRSAYVAAVTVRLLQRRGVDARAFWPSIAADRWGPNAGKAGSSLCIEAA